MKTARPNHRLRAVSPVFVEQGAVIFRALRPTIDDAGKLSLDDGALSTPNQLGEWRHSIPAKCAGVLVIPDSAFQALTIPLIPDPILAGNIEGLPPNAAHSVADFNQLSGAPKVSDPFDEKKEKRRIKDHFDIQASKLLGMLQKEGLMYFSVEQPNLSNCPPATT